MFKSCYENLGLKSKETISNASRLLQNNMFMYAETTGETQKVITLCSEIYQVNLFVYRSTVDCFGHRSS